MYFHITQNNDFHCDLFPYPLLGYGIIFQILFKSIYNFIFSQIFISLFKSFSVFSHNTKQCLSLGFVPIMHDKFHYKYLIPWVKAAILLLIFKY